ncbi:MAG: adenylate/guanylate cyclase domain-containing protein [Spirochaetales bacterium]|nr:adenylate/guanylate cyclase domain-containing protein [Spirochaetales bacterium]
MKKQLLLLTMFFSCLFVLFSAEPHPIAKRGIIDLSVLGSGEDILPVKGVWGFHWNELLTEIPSVGGEWVKAPGNWAAAGDYPPQGYASYTLVLEGLKKGEIYTLYVPEAVSAYRLYLNGDLLSANGTVGRDRESSVPQFLPRCISFTARGIREEIVFQVSNFHYRKSGIWRNFYIGTPAEILRFYTTKIVFSSLLAGMMFFVTVYFLVFSIFRREERAAYYLALLSLVFFIRIITTGEQLLTFYFPLFPWELARRLEFLPFSASAGFSMWYFYHLFPVEFNKKVLHSYTALTLVLGAVLILMPVRLSNHLIVPAEAILAAGLLYSFSVIVKASMEKRNGAVIILVSMIALFVSVINDILYSNMLIHTIYVSPFGFIFFMVSQTIMLSRRYAYSFRTIEDLTVNLKDFNRSISRFLPFKFMEYLNKDSVVEVEDDDPTLKKVTILYADIRSLTTLSEALSPEESLDAIKSFLSGVLPLIREADGFADKYIGDGIMALFPESPDKALKTAVKLQEAVKIFNRNRRKEGTPRLSMGVGLHSGGLMVGSIGSPDQAETGIISDSVKLAHTMEEMTSRYGASIIVSSDLFVSLEKPEAFESRNLGTTIVKGKRDPIGIIEIFDSLSDDELKLKKDTKPLFEEGLMNYEIMRFEEAAVLFHRVLKANPDDGAAAYYLNNCLELN